jgi:hypothetical protein
MAIDESMVNSMARQTFLPPSDCIRSAGSRASSGERGAKPTHFSIVVNDGYLYGPKLMQIRCAPRPSEWLVPSKGLPLLVGATVCSLVLSGCGGAIAASTSSIPSTTRVTSSPPTTSVTDAQILSAWLAAERAFADAALTSNSSAPDLTATMVSPQLEGVESALTTLKAANEVARGSMTYGSPRITQDGSTSASIVSCIHDKEIEVHVTTGQPVTGILGKTDFELVHSSMTLTNGGWKLASQTVEVGKCTGS